MLVLSRYAEQSVVLTLPDGRTVTVLVCSVDGRRVRLGIDAPKDVIIARAELLSAAGHGSTPHGKRQTLEEYDRLHNNGCSICRDPNCSDPGGKH